MSEEQIEFEQVTEFIKLTPGDIVHVRLDPGEGEPLPTSDEILDAYERWIQVMPEGVKVIVTHIGEEAYVVQ